MRRVLRPPPWFSIVAMASGLAATASCADDDLEARRRESIECLSETGTLFEQRIRPLLETDRPKTCNQCHLSGVDLGLFVRPTMCETRACLLQRGLANPSDVDASLVLSWIERASPESELITERVIAEEYDGFREFLVSLFACDSTSCSGVVCSNEGGPGGCAPSDEPVEPVPIVTTDCSAIAVEKAFGESVYAWRDRCFPCHHTDQLTADPAAPRWIEVFGGCNAGSATTLRTMLERGYLNFEEPAQSLVLLKPLTPAAGGVEHGGGQKFHDTADPAYVSILSFIDYYAGCASTKTQP